MIEPQTIPGLPLPSERWLKLVAQRRGNPTRTRGIKVVDGIAYATDNHILLAAPAGPLTATGTPDWGAGIAKAVKKAPFRSGKWRRVSRDAATVALAAEGQLQGAYRLVWIGNDEGLATFVQVPLLQVALKGLNLDRLKLACKSPESPVRLTDGDRQAWVSPVRTHHTGPVEIPQVLS